VDTSDLAAQIKKQRVKHPRRSIQERRAIVEETLLPGASVSRVARRHDVNANQVFHWRKLYREGRLGGGKRLAWENVDLSLRVATIPRSKNDEPVHIPLNSSAMYALAAFRARGDGSGRVVRNAAGKTLSVNAHWFPEILRAANIANLRWHDLRHSFASRLRQSGAPLGHIAELMGHKGLSMTRRYAHLSIANLHVAVSRISTDTPIAPEPIAQTRTVSYLQ
jgi:transposase-like protein